MPRNQNIFTDSPLWSHPKDDKQYFTVDEDPQALTSTLLSVGSKRDRKFQNDSEILDGLVPIPKDTGIQTESRKNPESG